MRELYRRHIRDAGLRATAPRVAVLGCLASQQRPLTHADVMKALGSDWDRATVYRNLADLTKAGLVRRYDMGDHVWRFEFDPRHGHAGPGHAHFICINCGDVQCIEDVKVHVPAARRLPRAIRNTNLEIQLKGVCDICA